MDIKVRVGTGLREIREKKGITQDALSKSTGVDRTFISHIESGNRNVSIETLERLLVGLNVSFKDFFKKKIFIG